MMLPWLRGGGGFLTCSLTQFLDNLIIHNKGVFSNQYLGTALLIISSGDCMSSAI